MASSTAPRAPALVAWAKKYGECCPCPPAPLRAQSAPRPKQRPRWPQSGRDSQHDLKKVILLAFRRNEVAKQTAATALNNMPRRLVLILDGEAHPVQADPPSLGECKREQPL